MECRQRYLSKPYINVVSKDAFPFLRRLPPIAKPARVETTARRVDSQYTITANLTDGILITANNLRRVLNSVALHEFAQHPYPL